MGVKSGKVGGGGGDGAAPAPTSELGLQIEVHITHFHTSYRGGGAGRARKLTVGCRGAPRAARKGWEAAPQLRAYAANGGGNKGSGATLAGCAACRLLASHGPGQRVVHPSCTPHPTRWPVTADNVTGYEEVGQVRRTTGGEPLPCVTGAPPWAAAAACSRCPCA